MNKNIQSDDFSVDFNSPEFKKTEAQLEEDYQKHLELQR